MEKSVNSGDDDVGNLTNGEAGSELTPTSDAVDKSLVVHVICENVPLKALMDTGSMISLFPYR